jgi:hypothetical protein
MATGRRSRISGSPPSDGDTTASSGWVGIPVPAIASQETPFFVRISASRRFHQGFAGWRRSGNGSVAGIEIAESYPVDSSFVRFSIAPRDRCRPTSGTDP